VSLLVLLMAVGCFAVGQFRSFGWTGSTSRVMVGKASLTVVWGSLQLKDERKGGFSVTLGAWGGTHSQPKARIPGVSRTRLQAVALPPAAPAVMGQSEIVSVSRWWVLGVLFVPTASCWWRARRKPRAQECSACGYDTTGLPERKCPECGAALWALLRRVWGRGVVA
jgi:hypothetical protein